MRIVAGDLKGMTLSQTVSNTTRPTSDSVRESIFNILAARISFDGMHVADLYAGTGALGIEAFSRGAQEITFVETDKNACSTISKNIEAVQNRIENSDRKLQVTRTPVLTFVQNAQNEKHFELVLADPPYDNDVETEVISIVASGGYLIYETSSKKLEDCEKAFSSHARTEEVIAARKMGNTGVVVVRAI